MFYGQSGVFQWWVDGSRLKTKIKTVNIKDDHPTVDVALMRLKQLLMIRNTGDVAAVKVIHGYGSTERGGDILAEEARL
jgi:hypothetical protein